MRNKVSNRFREIFDSNGEITSYFAPGRVNLIGEHTDYNGGHVFPCALTMGTYATVRKNNSDTLRMYSMNFEDIGVIESSIKNLKYEEKDNWSNYVKGVIYTFIETGYKIDYGMDVVFSGNIPNQSGLSSSASLEILTGYILKSLFDLDIDNIELALLGKRAENEFIGVNCGIMDQFAIAMGKKNTAIFLNTNDLSYEYAPINTDNVKIVIACSNKKRGLASSKYNERRSECEEALKELKSVIQIDSLGDLTEEEFEKNKNVIRREVCRKRAKHAVYENRRVIKTVLALKNNDLRECGKLMNESHISLRDDYEVTGKELDTLVESAWKQKGVIGSRMTGAGFGGCTVNIVVNENVKDFIKNVSEEYLDIIGYEADFYVAEIGDGPRKIN